MPAILAPEQSATVPRYAGQPPVGYIAHRHYRDRRTPVYDMAQARLRVVELNQRHADDCASLVLLDAQGKLARKPRVLPLPPELRPA